MRELLNELLKDERAFTLLYKKILITLQTKLRQKGGGQYPDGPPWLCHWSKWFAFSATSGQAIMRFALDVSLFKAQRKLCLIVIFAFSVHSSIKKFRFQNFYLFLVRSRVSQLFRLGLD